MLIFSLILEANFIAINYLFKKKKNSLAISLMSLSSILICLKIGLFSNLLVTIPTLSLSCMCKLVFEIILNCLDNLDSTIKIPIFLMNIQNIMVDLPPITFSRNCSLDIKCNL